MVDPITATAAVSSILSGAYGGKKQADSYKDAERALDAAAEEWRAINLPDLSPVEFEQYKDLFTPQIVQDTQLGKIQIDPAYKDAQMAALSQLGEISQGGLTLQDKANLNELQGEVARQDAARQGAIMQNMAARGMGGAGMELAQRLSAQQSGADRAAQGAQQVAAGAQARALQAIMDRGQLGGAMRAQEYGEKSDAARAQDMINQFNAGQRQEGQRIKQQTGMANTELKHREAMMPWEIAQQQFQNQVTRQQGVDRLAGTRADVTTGKGTKEGQIWGTLGEAIGKYGPLAGGK